MKYLFLTSISILFFTNAFAQNVWQDYTKIADSLALKSNFKDEILFRIRAIESAKEIENDTLPFLELLKNISQKKFDFVYQKDLASLSELKNQLEDLKTFGASSKRMFDEYNQLYQLANQTNNIQESEYFITQALSHYSTNGDIDALSYVKALQRAGDNYKKTDKLSEAVKMFKKAVETCEIFRIEDANILGSNFMNLSELYRYRNLDNPKKFVNYLKEAQTVYEKANSVNNLIRVYFNLSDFTSSKGDFEQSINYLKKAFSTYKKEIRSAEIKGQDKRDIEKEIKFHNYFIEKYRLVSDKESMSYHLNEILKLANPKFLNDNVKDLISLSYIYLVEYYENTDNDKALELLKEGSKFFPFKDLYFIKEEYDMHFAKIYMDKGEYNKAEKILNTLIANKKLPAFIIKTALERSTILNIKTQKLDKAYLAINNLLVGYFGEKDNVDIEIFKYEDFRPGTVLSDTQRFLNIAQEFEIASQNEIAHRLHWMALKQFEANLSKEILSDRIAALYSDVCLYFYKKASNNGLTTKERNAFIKFTEAIESKHLINTFLKNRRESGKSKIDDLITEEQSIRLRITNLKKQNVKNPIDSLSQLIFEENLKLEKVGEQLDKNSNKIADLVNTDGILKKIENNYIIKYKLINNNLFRIEFNNGNIVISEIKNYSALNKEIEQVINDLKIVGSSINKIKESAAALYNKLLANTEFLQADNDVVSIIPDGILNYLPFELLIDNEKYLFETKTISYASCLSFIDNSIKENFEKKSKKNIALFAPKYQKFVPLDVQVAVRGEPYYLEGALEEVTSISKLFDDSDVFINDKASKKSFRTLSKDYSILHLSMHSYINDEDAELSSLVFSDNETDYELYISELYGLNLNADMAVLSACNTGVGKYKTGKGIVSMNNAFIAAGVPSVLSSLWSAPDKATQKIMTSFYKHLKRGERKDTALKNAKLDYLNATDDPNLRHPYYWAGFVLTGDTSAIVSGTNWWVYIIGAIMILILLFLVVKKRLKAS